MTLGVSEIKPYPITVNTPSCRGDDFLQERQGSWSEWVREMDGANSGSKPAGGWERRETAFQQTVNQQPELQYNGLDLLKIYSCVGMSQSKFRPQYN